MRLAWEISSTKLFMKARSAFINKYQFLRIWSVTSCSSGIVILTPPNLYTSAVLKPVYNNILPRLSIRWKAWTSPETSFVFIVLQSCPCWAVAQVHRSLLSSLVRLKHYVSCPHLNRKRTHHHKLWLYVFHSISKIVWKNNFQDNWSDAHISCCE